MELFDKVLNASISPMAYQILSIAYLIFAITFVFTKDWNAVINNLLISSLSLAVSDLKFKQAKK